VDLITEIFRSQLAFLTRLNSKNAKINIISMVTTTLDDIQHSI